VGYHEPGNFMNFTNFINFMNFIYLIIKHLSQGCTTPATTVSLFGKIPLSHKSINYPTYSGVPCTWQLYELYKLYKLYELYELYKLYELSKLP
jgi:hypothetical protein